MKFWAILPAAGIGRRMGSSTPKQYHSICGTPVLIHSINRLLEIPEIEHLVVALHPKDQHWPAFNFADSYITIGAFLYIYTIFTSQKENIA